MTHFSQRTELSQTAFAEGQQPDRKGFTLVEIMAATGIMVAVILLVLSLTTNVLNTWNFSSGQLAQNYEARIAMDFLSQDIEAAVFRNNGMVWMESQVHTVEEAKNQSELYFFSPVTDRERGTTANPIPGDICAVAYMTAFQNPFSTSSTSGKQYGLYRGVVDARNTFDTALGMPSYISDTGTVEAANSLSSLWTGGTMKTRVQQENGTTGAGIDKNVNQTWLLGTSNYMSANVANFQVVFSYKTTDGEVKSISSNEAPNGQPLSFVLADELYINGSATPKANYDHLIYADIKMTVLSDEAASMVANGTWGAVSSSWNGFLREYGENFTRRVYIMSNPI